MKLYVVFASYLIVLMQPLYAEIIQVDCEFICEKIENVYESDHMECDRQCRSNMCKHGCSRWKEASNSSCRNICQKLTSWQDSDNLGCTLGCVYGSQSYLYQLRDAVGEPLPPQVVGGTIGNTSIGLRWKGNNLLPNAEFLVQLRRGDSTNSWHYYQPVTVLKRNRVLVQNLKPFTKYQFRIAWIVLQDQPPILSDVTPWISTLPSGPPQSPPRNVRAIPMDCSRIELLWDLPTYTAGEIISYTLYIEDMKDEKEFRVDINKIEDDLKYIVEGLSPNTTYLMNLTATNNQGEGPVATTRATTYAKLPDVSSGRGHLLMSSANSLLKLGLDVMVSPDFVFNTTSGANITGIAVHIPLQLVYISDLSGAVSQIHLPKDLQRILLKPFQLPGIPTTLTVDWLFGYVYAVVYAEKSRPPQWQIWRFDLMGKNVLPIVTGMTYQPMNLEADPFHGYLWWISNDIDQGLHRLDVGQTAENPERATSRVVYRSGSLGSLTLDSPSFRVIAVDHSKNTLLAISIDGSSVKDIRPNIQQSFLDHVQSLTHLIGRYYWTNGKQVFSEELIDGTYYHNSYAFLGTQRIGKLVGVHSSVQSIPVPLNPPRNVQAIFDSKSVKITWEEPQLPVLDGPGAWRNWKYEVLRQDQHEKIISRSNLSFLSLLMRDLVPSSNYSIKVRAYSPHGKGPWSSTFSGRTLAPSKKISRILWTTTEGVFLSNIDGTDVDMLNINKFAENSNPLSDIYYGGSNIFICRNKGICKTYNETGHLIAEKPTLRNINRIAVDFSTGRVFGIQHRTNSVQWAGHGENKGGAIQLTSSAIDISIDYVRGWLYYTTSYGVYKATLSGRNISVIHEENVFSGRQVYGLTLDVEIPEVWWAIQDSIGTSLYSSLVDGRSFNPQIRKKLSTNIKQGSLSYANEVFLWLNENNEIIVMDKYLQGTYTVGDHGHKILMMVPQQIPIEKGSHFLMPGPIDLPGIHVNGTWKDFRIVWGPLPDPKSNLHYEVTVSGSREVASFVVSDAHVSLGWHVDPHTQLNVSIRGVTNWAIGPITTVLLNSPSSLPTEPIGLRVFTILHKSSKSFVLRWFSPTKPNGVITNYKAIHCWKKDGTKWKCSEKFLEGHLLEARFSGNWTLDSIHKFNVSAYTSIGEGPSSFLTSKLSAITELPSLIISTDDIVGEYDVDVGQFHNKIVGYKINQVAYLAKEHQLVIMDTNSDVFKQENTTGLRRITRLEGKGKSLSFDWIGRRLFWLESNTFGVTKVEIYEFISGRKINIIQFPPNSNHLEAIVASPLDNLIYVKEEEDGVSNLMAYSMSNYSSFNLFDNNHNEEATCNCPKSPSLAPGITVDSSSLESSPFYVTLKKDSHEGHLETSVLKVTNVGCTCKVVVTLKDFGYDGTCDSLVVDRTYLFCYMGSKQTLLWMPKEGPTRKEDIHSRKMEDVKALLTADPLCQPLPRIDCLLVLENSILPSKVDLRENLINLRLSQPHTNEDTCGKVALPSGFFLVFYDEVENGDSASCSKNINLCQYKRSTESNMTITGLRPFTKYVFRIAYETPYNELFNIPVQPGEPIYYKTRAIAPKGTSHVTVNPISPHNIKVTFETPSERFFQIHWRSEPGITNFMSSSLTPESEEKTSLVLEDLSPSTKYQIWIRTFSEEDPDIFTDSPKVYSITFPEPARIKLLSSNSTALHIGWTSPESGIVVSHMFQYKASEATYWNDTSEERTNPGQFYSPALIHLDPATTYQIRAKITYNTSQLFQFVWPKSPFQFTTLDDIPGVPGAVKIHKDGWKVWWESPADNGSPITDYEIYLSKGTEWNSTIHVKDNFWNIDSNYDASASYSFKVRATNTIGTGPWSQQTLIRSLTGPKIVETSNWSTILATTIPSSITFFVLVAICIFWILRRSETHWNKCKSGSLGLDTMQPPPAREIDLAPSSHLPINNDFAIEDNILYSMQNFTGDDIDLPHVSRNSINLTKFLGSGAFGEVYEGTASEVPGITGITKVAIKTLRKGATENEKEGFMKEAQLMSHFNHEHILRLLAVCTDQAPFFLILELMQGGDLLSYLRANRQGENSLRLKDLIEMCRDVAKGCVYLEEMHFVHRDLAARNCLVSSTDSNQRLVKIGDFGLARDIYKNDYYRKEGEGLLPVRWMSPESLLDGVFTTQSDVWAFGVLLWEIMTLGQQPYPARTNLEVLHHVRSGGKPVRPQSAPEDLCVLTEQCWSYNPDARPTFKDCLTLLLMIQTTAAPAITVHNIHYLTDLEVFVEDALPSQRSANNWGVRSEISEDGGSGASTLPLNVPLRRQQQYLQLVDEDSEPPVPSYEIPIHLQNHPGSSVQTSSQSSATCVPIANSTPLCVPTHISSKLEEDLATLNTLTCSAIPNSNHIPSSMTSQTFFLPMPSLPPRLSPIRRLSFSSLPSTPRSPQACLLSPSSGTTTTLTFPSYQSSSRIHPSTSRSLSSSPTSCTPFNPNHTPYGYTSMTSNCSKTVPDDYLTGLFHDSDLLVPPPTTCRRLSGVSDLSGVSGMTSSSLLDIEGNQGQSLC